MKLNSKIVLIGIVCFLTIVIYGYIDNYDAELGYEFNGIVQNVEYSLKGYPKFSIRNKTYDFANPYFLKYTGVIEKGDSLLKRGGSLEIMVIKRN